MAGEIEGNHETLIAGVPSEIRAQNSPNTLPLHQTVHWKRRSKKSKRKLDIETKDRYTGKKERVKKGKRIKRRIKNKKFWEEIIASFP
jgi:hypothetical protein